MTNGVQHFNDHRTSSPTEELKYTEIIIDNLPIKLVNQPALRASLEKNLVQFFNLTPEQAKSEIENYINRNYPV